MSDAPALSAIEARLKAVERQNATQTDKLDESLRLMRMLHTSIAGSPELGITGLAATAASAHRRIDVAVIAGEPHAFTDSILPRARELYAHCVDAGEIKPITPTTPQK